MLLRKDLPAVKDARIYLSMERTFLGYMKLASYLLSFAVVLDKIKISSEIAQKIHIQVQMVYLILVFSVLSILAVVVGFVVFYMDLRYIEGGVEVSPEKTTDSRVYMASERTFLSWVRTSIDLVVFGFIVEKFEFFFVQLGKVFGIHIQFGYKDLIGVGILIILIGVLTLIVGMLNFYSTIRKVDRGSYRTSVKFYLAYGTMLFLVCVLLTVYMLGSV